MSRWFVATDPVLPAALLPATVLEAALGLGVDVQRLLAGTRLFPTDFYAADRSLATTQLVRMLQNLARYGEARDTFFRVGALAAPAALGPVGPLLASAPTPRHALRALVVYRRLFLPFVQMRIVTAADDLWLVFDDGAGARDAWSGLVEICAALLVETFRGLGAERPDARWVFAHREPEHVEQYHEALGMALAFDAPLTAVRLPSEWLDRRLDGASTVRWRIARRACAETRRARDPGPGFVEAVRAELLRVPRRHAAITPMAERFAMSPATFKRRLKEHGVGFQALADHGALALALELMVLRERAPEEVVRLLGFSDPSNFRRAFKRWTGRRPTELLEEARSALAPVVV